MRKVPPWTGKTDDTKIPDRVRLRLYILHGGVCPRCSRKLRSGHWELDHKLAIANGGLHSEENLEPVCTTPCHREKTREDRKIKAKTDRTQKSYWGIKKKPKRKMLYRRFNGEIVDPNRRPKS